MVFFLGRCSWLCLSNFENVLIDLETAVSSLAVVLPSGGGIDVMCSFDLRTTYRFLNLC